MRSPSPDKIRPDSGRPAGVGNDLRIIMLEDNDTDAELIAFELQAAGLSIVLSRAETRDEFVAQLWSFLPDVILADYSLPQFSALDALKILKQEKFDIPVILVTGSQSEEVAVYCMNQGVDDYILKQSLARLPSAIHNVLEKRKAQREREYAEQALRRSEEKFRRLFANNPIPMFVYDVGTLRFLEVNESAIFHYGYTREEFGRLWVTDLWTLEEVQRLQAMPSMPSSALALNGRWVHQRKDGHQRSVDIICQPLDVDERRTALMIVQDITERAQAEESLRQSREELRALTAHLQSVREEERSLIAREIHDELGQILTAIRMDLAWLHDKLNVQPGFPKETLQAHTTSMTDLVDSTIRTVRRISTELRPEILDDLGLIPAIEWQAQEFRTRTGIECDFEANVEEIQLDRQRSTAVFRILQESLTNVARHAHATRVGITLTASEGELTLEVVDNGSGLREDKISALKSLGLLGMRERAYLLGGRVSITGKPDHGTNVTVWLPLSDGGADIKAKT